MFCAESAVLDDAAELDVLLLAEEDAVDTDDAAGELADDDELDADPAALDEPLPPPHPMSTRQSALTTKTLYHTLMLFIFVPLRQTRNYPY